MSAITSAQNIASQCIEIGRRTGAFTESEMEVLVEVLVEWVATRGRDYLLNLTLGEEGQIEGFIIYGKAPMTQFAWDVYWIVVSPERQGEGKGKSLIRTVEKRLLRMGGPAILRIETSGRPSYERQRRFYEACGYSVAGRIEDFYSPGDALITYVKRLESTRNFC